MVVELEIDLSEEQIARIVNSTFDEADLDRNGLIDMHEYQVRDVVSQVVFVDLILTLVLALVRCVAGA